MRTKGSQAAAEDLREVGFVIFPDVLSPIQCDAVIRGVEANAVAGAGSRNLLDQPWCQSLAIRMKDDPRIGPLLPAQAVAVQCTLFEKSAAHKNWLVTLHQDLSIPVRDKLESADCSGWSESLRTTGGRDSSGAFLILLVDLHPCTRGRCRRPAPAAGFPVPGLIYTGRNLWV
jgi:hypothetical protein